MSPTSKQRSILYHCYPQSYPAVNKLSDNMPQDKHHRQKYLQQEVT